MHVDFHEQYVNSHVRIKLHIEMYKGKMRKVRMYVSNIVHTVGIKKKFPSRVRTTGRVIPFRSRSVPV